MIYRFNMNRVYNKNAGADVMKALRTNSTSPTIALAAGVSERTTRKVLLALYRTGLVQRVYLGKVKGYEYTPRAKSNLPAIFPSPVLPVNVIPPAR